MTRRSLRSFILAAACSSLAAFVACGGIVDPTKPSTESVAKVSGALQGASVPDGARVALVWRSGSTGPLAVSSDVAVINGAFTMALDPPPDSYFMSSGDSSEITIPNSVSNGFAFNVAPRDTVSGGIVKPLAFAIAGFVVYVDTNGNGKLDVDGSRWVESTDTILGGNDEFVLTYLRDGSALDFKKLQDRSGASPTAGYNLMWLVGESWLPLDGVELKLEQHSRLPSPICDDSDGTGSHTDSQGPGGSRPGSSSPGSHPYPASDDPGVTCADGGTTYIYAPPMTDCITSDPVDGLCAPADETVCTTPPGIRETLVPGAPVPEGWPCPIDEVLDGGAAP